MGFPYPVTETHLSSQKNKGKGRRDTRRNVPGKVVAGNGVWMDQFHPNGSRGIACISEESNSLQIMEVKI